MRKRLIDLRGDEEPILDIASYGRTPVPLTRRQLTQITLTVRRAPEVMVKVSGGARTVGGVEQHLAYIGRDGEVGLRTDSGEVLGGEGVARAITADWNLDMDSNRGLTERSIRQRQSPKLVHNLIFSMPSGTSPKALMAAVQKLANNEWALKHRYVMALHTDSGHPHVHVVLLARDIDGNRLNIRKADLRSWRVQFAENLRELGVTANATERAVRGLSRTRKNDGIYRAAQRQDSTHLRKRWSQLAKEVAQGEVAMEPGSHTVKQTWDAVVEGWRLVANKLRAAGEHEHAGQIRSFLGSMPPPMTEKEQLMRSKPEAKRLQPGDIDRERTLE